MSRKMMPACKLCGRQSHDLNEYRLHPQLCSELVMTTGSWSMAEAVLEVMQEHCTHPTYRSDYDYAPGLGRDHWWWCPTCHKVAFVTRPSWAA